MNNKRQERFIKVAETRTNKITKLIRLLSNCSNKSSYEYSDEDVKRIFNALEKELRTARARFVKSEKTIFTLREK